MIWLLAVVLVPLCLALLMLLFPRFSKSLHLLVALASPLLAFGLVWQVLQNGSISMLLGGWSPLLAIRWQADSVNSILVLLSSVLHLMVSLYALSVAKRDRLVVAFWPLSTLLLASLQALWFSRDLFNLYVCLELLGMVAVALVTLSGGKAIAPALRYLMFSLFASLCYLLGVALIYAGSGALDITLLAGQLEANALNALALGLITLGLLLKAAGWPLHIWLPAAHAAAPAAVSALLSALVVKGPLFILFLVWTQLAPQAFLPYAAQVFSWCALGALLLGGLAAWRTPFNKMLVAYSTVAQLGYALLALSLLLSIGLIDFQLAFWVFIISHALAKAACFMAVGELQQGMATKQISHLSGATQVMPLAMFAFAVAGGSLIGLPPSGGFLMKWHFLLGLWQSAEWFWLALLLLATLISAAYIFRIIVVGFFRLPSGITHPTSAQPTNLPAVLFWPQFYALLPALLVWVLAFASLPLGQWLSGGMP